MAERFSRLSAPSNNDPKASFTDSLAFFFHRRSEPDLIQAIKKEKKKKIIRAAN